MLDADDLAGMRETQVDAQPETAVVQRATETPDGAGGQTLSWAAIATTTARVANATESEAERANVVSATGVFTLTFPAATDVTTADRVVVGSATYQVTGVLSGSWETARRVLSIEVEP